MDNLIADDIAAEPGAGRSPRTPVVGVALGGDGAPDAAHDIANVFWWQVYPLGFTGAPIRPDTEAQRAPAQRLRRLIPWLDHMTDMGFTGLLLGPIFSSTSHGYDTVHPPSNHPRLGADDPFAAPAPACHCPL